MMNVCKARYKTHIQTHFRRVAAFQGDRSWYAKHHAHVIFIKHYSNLDDNGWMLASMNQRFFFTVCLSACIDLSCLDCYMTSQLQHGRQTRVHEIHIGACLLCYNSGQRFHDCSGVKRCPFCYELHGYIGNRQMHWNTETTCTRMV